MTFATLLVDIALGLGIGLSLGLLGGGGSILTVPALVYLIGQTPQVAVTASLVIVGANSAMGVLFHRAQGTLNWHIALLFGGVGMITAYLAAGVSKSFSPQVLMILFALLMLGVGAMLILHRSPSRDEKRQANLVVTLASGALVGMLTGFLGVGGGFLIVPALVLLVGLPMRQAVGTSLAVIAMNSFAGFLGHLDGFSIDYGLIAVFVVAGMAGTFIGARLTQRFQPDHLRRLFATFVMLLAVFLLIDNLRGLVG